METKMGDKIIIGFCGKAQVGKDSAADYLVEHYGFVKMNFAGYLKEIAEQAGWNGLKDNRGRRYLMHLGDVMREYDPAIFIKELYCKINRHEALCQDTSPEFDCRIVISDIRLADEVAAIKEIGGQVCLILRDINGAEDHATERMDETWSDKVDFVMQNNGSFSQLYNGVESMFNKIKKTADEKK